MSDLKFVVAPELELLKFVGEGKSAPATIAEITGASIEDVRNQLLKAIEAMGAPDITHAWLAAAVIHGAPVPERLADAAERLVSSNIRLTEDERNVLTAYLHGVTLQKVVKRLGVGVANSTDAVFLAHQAGLLLPEFTQDDQELLRHVLLGHSPDQCREERGLKNVSAVFEVRTKLYRKFGATDASSLLAVLIPARLFPPMPELQEYVKRLEASGLSYDHYKLFWSAIRGYSRTDTAANLGLPLFQVSTGWKEMFTLAGLEDGGAINPSAREAIVVAAAFWAGLPFHIPATDPLLSVTYQRVLYALAVGVKQSEIGKVLGLASGESVGATRDLYAIFDSHLSWTTIARAVNKGAMQVPPWLASNLQLLHDEPLRRIERRLLQLMIGGERVIDIKQKYSEYRDADGLLVSMRLHAGVESTETLILLACLAGQIEFSDGFAVALLPGQELLAELGPDESLWSGLEPEPATTTPATPIVAPPVAPPAAPSGLALVQAAIAVNVPVVPPAATESEPDPVLAPDSDPEPVAEDEPVAPANTASLEDLTERDIRVIEAWTICSSERAIRTHLGGITENEYSARVDAVMDAVGLDRPTQAEVVAWAVANGLSQPVELGPGIQSIIHLKGSRPTSFAKDLAVWRVLASGGGIGVALKESGYKKADLDTRTNQWRTWKLFTTEMVIAAAAFAGVLDEET